MVFLWDDRGGCSLNSQCTCSRDNHMSRAMLNVTIEIGNYISSRWKGRWAYICITSSCVSTKDQHVHPLIRDPHARKFPFLLSKFEISDFFSELLSKNNALIKFTISCNRILLCMYQESRHQFSWYCALLNKHRLVFSRSLSFLFKFKSVWQGPGESAVAGRSPLGDLG